MTDNNKPAFEGGHDTIVDIDTKGIGDTAMKALAHETENAIIIPETSPERQAAYHEKQPGEKYLYICSDDRGVTPENRALLLGLGVADPDTAIRYYGGTFGLSRVLAVTTVVQHGVEALGSDNINGFVATSQERIRAANPDVVPTKHTAEANEGNPSRFNPGSEQGLGCAYAGSIGAVTGFNTDPAVQALAEHEVGAASGAFDPITKANEQIVDALFGGDANFQVTRRDYIELDDSPTVVLKGSHAKPIDDGDIKAATVVLNYGQKISNSRQANEAKVPFYGCDVTQTAEILLRAFPELHLDPPLLLNVMEADIAATRKALVGGEGHAAEELKLERYGDREEAIAYLESLAATL